jgi:ribosome maturation factor RimP
MEVREEVRQLAGPLADEAGYELVDVEFAAQGRHRIIRVLIDKQGGVTVGDCSVFSRRLSDCLDMNQTVAGAYHLEVSSPGNDRPLRSIESVQRFAGSPAVVMLHEPVDGRRKFDGELLGAMESRVGVRTTEGTEHWFEWAAVRSARLNLDPWGAVRSRGESR